MRRQLLLFFGLLGAVVVAGCGGNVILDSDGAGSGGAGSSGAGSGGSSPISVGAGGAGGGSMGAYLGHAYTCDYMMAGEHVCAEYANLPAADLQAEQSACTSEGGTSGDYCAAAGRLGACEVPGSALAYSLSYYSGEGITAMQLQQACTASGGIWVPG